MRWDRGKNSPLKAKRRIMSVNLKPNERAPPVFFSQDHGMAHTGEGEGCDISEKTWEVEATQVTPLMVL